MCKSCVNSADRHRINLSINDSSCTVASLQFNELSICGFFAQLFQPYSSVVIHIIYSIFTAVKSGLSTISTHPTIKTTNLINKLLIMYKTGRPLAS